jgi:hypothetical protein
MKIINCLALLMFSFNVLADDVKIDCSFPDDYLKNKLTTQYKELQKEAMKVGIESCKNLLKILPSESSTSLTESMNRFTSKTKTILDETYPDSIFPGMEALSTQWANQVNEFQNDYRYLDFIQDKNDTIKGPPRRVEWQVWLQSSKSKAINFKLDDKQLSACNKVLGDNSCSNGFESLQNAVSPFQYPYSIGVLKDNGRKLTLLQNDWNSFIDKSRYQTPLDVWLTTTYYGDRFNGKDLVGPPNAQFFLLHPTVVYEHLDSVDKGDRDKVSLAIEWAGINWWRKGFGFSVTSTYRDQSNVRSTSLGLTLHIKNRYSFGFASRGHGDNSFFINFDLLEWFGDKKEKYKKYKDYF